MDNDTTPLKKCAFCECEFPATHEFFNYDKSRRDGFASRCRHCKTKRRTKEVLPDGYRRCTKCKEIKPQTFEYFHRHHKAPNGFNWWCRLCVDDYQSAHAKEIAHKRRVRDEKNKDYISKRMSEYGHKNRERLRESKRRYRIEHREKHLNQRRNWLRNNYDHVIQYRRNYTHQKPHILLAIRARREARKLSLPDTFTSRHWILCCEYFHDTCAVCGHQLRDLFGEIEPNADHWIALNSPGCPGTVPENMICLCNSCNSSKQDKLPEQWLLSRYSKRKAQAILKRITDYFDWIQQQ